MMMGKQKKRKPYSVADYVLGEGGDQPATRQLSESSHRIVRTATDLMATTAALNLATLTIGTITGIARSN